MSNQTLYPIPRGNNGSEEFDTLSIDERLRKDVSDHRVSIFEGSARRLILINHNKRETATTLGQASVEPQYFMRKDPRQRLVLAAVNNDHIKIRSTADRDRVMLINGFAPISAAPLSDQERLAQSDYERGITDLGANIVETPPQDPADEILAKIHRIHGETDQAAGTPVNTLDVIEEQIQKAA